MAHKISFKIFNVFFSCWILLILSACIIPVDIQTFMDSDEVKVIIETVNNPQPPAEDQKVKVDDKTGDGLTGTNEKINGLNPNKYYMVEKEMDDKGDYQPGYPKYATERLGNETVNGQLMDELGFITKIRGGSIFGLTNLHTYTVRTASAFSGSAVSYSDNGGANQSATVTNGAITIPAPTGNLTLVGLDTDYLGYKVVGVAVNPATLQATSDFYNQTAKTISAATTSIKLEGEGTEVDYIFVNPADPTNFKVLNVTVLSAPATVTGVTVTPTTASVHKGETRQFTATVTGTHNPAQTVTWSIDDPKVAGTTITADGLLTVAIDETAATLTIKAISTLDTTKSGTATVTLTAALTYSIILSQSADYSFTPNATFGYTSAPSPLNVNVTNNGTGDTGALTVALSGANAGSFVLSTSSIATIAAGATATNAFYVVPKTGLNAGTYTAIVTVSGGNSITASFNVNFTVNAKVIDIDAIPGVTAPVTGATPVTTITSTTQYTGTVSWTPTVASGGTFAASTSYTATITLTPISSNYTLTGVGANFFSVAGSSVTNDANAVNIKAVFPATDAAPPTTGSNPFTITFTITDEGNGKTVSSSIDSISRGNFISGSSVSISLSGTWDTVRWSVDGISDTVVDSHTTSNVLTITNAQDFWPALAGSTFTITLRAAVKGGVNYSPNPPNNRVTINVTN